MPTTERTITVPYGELNKCSLWIKDANESPGEFNFTNKLTGYKITKKLNSVWKLKAEIKSVTADNLNYVNEGNTVKFFVQNDVWFVGIIKTVNVKNGVASITADEAVADDLSNYTFGRIEYTDTAFNTVSSAIVNGTSVTLDTSENFGDVTIRFDGETRLEGLHEHVEGVGYDWHPKWTGATYDTFELDIEASRGDSDVYTFARTGTGANIVESSKKPDMGRLTNYIEVYGYGDGDLQLQSAAFHATTTRSTLASSITASANTLTLSDASSFPSSGDIWIGCEKCSYTGKSTNTLTGITRATDYLGNANQLPSWEDNTSGYAHDAGVAVYDAQYTTGSPQTDSSIDTYGLAKARSINRNVINQSALDRIAQNIIDKYKTPPEYNYILTHRVFDVLPTVGLGDDVSVTDAQSGLSGTYRVKSLTLERKTKSLLLKIELSNYDDDMAEVIDRISLNLDKEASRVQGSPNYIPLHLFENADGSKYGIIRMYLPSEIVAIKKAELRFRLTDFRAYNDSNQTSASESDHNHSVTVSASGDHGHNLAHCTDAWPTSGFPITVGVGTTTGSGDHTHDAETTTDDGSHTHSITMSFGIYEEDLSDPPTPSVDIYFGEAGESFSKVNASAFTTENSTLSQDITSQVKALGTGKTMEVQFRCNKNMRIECYGYILCHLKP